jgi:hypothetical protein
MYLANLITKPLYEYEYQFAICESCFWCATVFHKSITKQEQEGHIIGGDSSNNNNFQQQICPVCKDKRSISLTPLSKDEMHRISTQGKGGLHP